MNTVEYIQEYLYEHIPMSRAMQVEVLNVTNNTVKLCAPLAPNINHRETIFGGSASAIAILSAWSLVHFRLQDENFNCRVVIQKNTVNYEKPIPGTFEAICNLPNDGQWEKFIKILKRKGRSRIILKSTLEYSGKIVGEFEGSFVAITI
jgi:thioesterase domain-containing protein